MIPYENWQYGLLFMRIIANRLLIKRPQPDSIQYEPSGIFLKYFRLMTILALFLAFFIGIFLEHTYGIGKIHLPLLMLITGIILYTLGLALQIYSKNCLGKYYASRVIILKAHEVINTGPYRYIRHPGSLGAIATYLGIALATDNWLIGALIILFTAVLYIYYIEKEERFLVKYLSDYKDYQKRTARLLPAIY